MLTKVKTALRISTDSFDSELTDLIKAAVADLAITGATIPATITTSGITITDPLINRAVITYCRCNFGEPDDYDRMKASYDEQKAQIRENSAYQGEES